MTGRPDLAVILAAGRGTRMQADAARAAGLDDAQRAAAERGLKTLVPIGGRPFLAWVLDAVAAAGFGDACVVTGDGDEPLRAALAEAPLRVRLARQTQARGTADAVLAAATEVGDRCFAVLNADNHYPPEALRLLRSVPAPATIGFPPDERASAFALMRAGDDGCLKEIVEKPDDAARRRMGSGVTVSMTCWSFTSAIFAHCRAVAPSARGELELPDAVRRLAATTCIRVLRHAGPVLDLSAAADIPGVARALTR